MRATATNRPSAVARANRVLQSSVVNTGDTLLRRVALAAIPLALVWSYWTTFVSLWREWQADPNYSVGQLVPLAALYLLWQDRHDLAKCRSNTNAWGALLILAAQAVRAYGLIFLFESAERYSIVLTIWGLTLFLFGWTVFRRMGWVLLFLVLMVPLPGRIHNLISGPLQGVAAYGAVFCLELIGITVTQEGHVLLLNDKLPIAVAEACSGLRMLTAFVVVGCVLAYIVSRPRSQKLLLLLSTIPVAILCNLLRLVITAVLFLKVSGEFADRFFHDFAGWTMMPLAVLMLAVELWIMSRLFVSDPIEE